jgi:hypothetical protein
MRGTIRRRSGAAPSSPTARGTPHRLARGFWDGEGGVEGGAGFQHRAGDIEEAVGNPSKRASMTVPAAPESGVFGPALGVMLDGNACPMVRDVAEAVMAGLSSDDDAAFARLLGNRCGCCRASKASASSVARTVLPTPGKDARISTSCCFLCPGSVSVVGMRRSGCQAADARP